MAVWAIADLHLSLGIPNKKMDKFGKHWENHEERLKTNWNAMVAPDDLVLLPGDISWALRLEEVIPDLEFIDNLPGTKVMIRGNHDYWWTSLAKIERIRPPSVHYIQNSAFLWNDVVIGGTRLWDVPGLSFDSLLEEEPQKDMQQEAAHNTEEDVRLFEREILRMENSLKEMEKLKGSTRLFMTHYPPIGVDLASSKASALFEKYGVQHCLFGHIHNVKHGIDCFGAARGVRYQLVAGDHLDFKPLKILD